MMFGNHLDVSENSGTPKIIHFNRVFHYKPSILGYPYFWKPLGEKRPPRPGYNPWQNEDLYKLRNPHPWAGRKTQRIYIP